VPIGLELLKPMVRCLEQTESGRRSLPRRRDCGAQLGRPGQDAEAGRRQPEGPSGQAAKPPCACELPYFAVQMARKDVRLLINAPSVGLEVMPSVAQLHDAAIARGEGRVATIWPLSGIRARAGRPPSKNGRDPGSRGSPYPCGHFKDDSVGA
jgi:hypothetical protein